MLAASNEYLQVLDLSWNCIRPLGGVAIARGVQVSACYPKYFNLALMLFIVVKKLFSANATCMEQSAIEGQRSFV
jgi:hypothetical protein